MHGEAALADLQQARVSGLGELAKLKRKDARGADSVDLQEPPVSGLSALGKCERKDAWTSTPGRFARSTSEQTQRTDSAYFQ
ncbi:hypothetical protein CDL15_Pgr027244 [Punica granatum]|uniref:Uncharacterized protein n=1 Tax=Punica granatum TaxID=22663 RepID=A0A218Y488_PUNGR|nr:hypothetical protein CDL15_Pgr027244 [Punica granatum]